MEKSYWHYQKRSKICATHCSSSTTHSYIQILKFKVLFEAPLVKVWITRFCYKRKWSKLYVCRVKPTEHTKQLFKTLKLKCENINKCILSRFMYRIYHGDIIMLDGHYPTEHRSGDVVILQALSSLAVKKATYGAASGSSMVEVATFPFRCKWHIFTW